MNDPFLIKHLYLARGHNYFGHHQQSPSDHPMEEMEAVECVTGRGLRGDRFFDYKDDYAGQVTFFAWEVYQELSAALQIRDRDPSVFRRNLITQGVDLNTLIDREFTVQGVQFLGTKECSPCYWMDRAFGPGAEEKLQGQGGLRAKILQGGWLTRTVI